MNAIHKKSIIIVADDDEDDRLLITEAIRENGFAGEIHSFEDGEGLMTHLNNWCSPETVILLDLNMPKMDGRQVLREIKSNPQLSFIPVVVLSTSSNMEDIEVSYGFGANSYIIKPATYDELKKRMNALVNYWFQTAILPAL